MPQGRNSSLFTAHISPGSTDSRSDRHQAMREKFAFQGCSDRHNRHNRHSPSGLSLHVRKDTTDYIPQVMEKGLAAFSTTSPLCVCQVKCLTAAPLGCRCGRRRSGRRRRRRASWRGRKQCSGHGNSCPAHQPEYPWRPACRRCEDIWLRHSNKLHAMPISAYSCGNMMPSIVPAPEYTASPRWEPSASIHHSVWPRR